MPFSKTEKIYGGLARTYHWLTVLLLTGSFSIGLYMSDLKVSPTKLRLFSYHKWIGVTVFLLVLLRLGWRLGVPPPPLPDTMASWEKRSAEAMHRLLYLFLFAAPLTGWLMGSAKGISTVYFGVLKLPDLLDKNPPLGAALETVHVVLVWIFLGFIAVHVLAALKHHFVDRDDVLVRMTPGLSPPAKRTTS